MNDSLRQLWDTNVYSLRPLCILLLEIPHQQGRASHRERLRPLLDHKPFDNMRQDLGFHNGLWWFILTILGGSAGDAGGRISVP